MKKSKLIWLVLGLLIVAAGGLFWWRTNLLPVERKTTAKKQTFIVRKGESSSLVGQHLKDEGLIRSIPVFEIYLFINKLSDKIQAGSFQLTPNLKMAQIVEILSHGTADIWLTFPEGWRKEEFGRRLAANLENFDYQEFVRASEKLEGTLFPDTYLLPKQASISAVLKIFKNNFEKKFPQDLEIISREKGLTKDQVLIFASIIEREAKLDNDRAIVAGILIKRWKNNWPLQADATIQYAIAPKDEENWWSEITKEDLEVNSPYNTYKNKGLPPGPICNPGLAAIKAVIYPQETSYWYYLSDQQGEIHYAQTVEEHNNNISQYLR